MVHQCGLGETLIVVEFNFLFKFFLFVKRESFINVYYQEETNYIDELKAAITSTFRTILQIISTINLDLPTSLLMFIFYVYIVELEHLKKEQKQTL